MPTALDPRLIELLKPHLPDVAALTVQQIMREVPAYAGAFGGALGSTIANAVQMALSGFLRLASSGRLGDQPSPGSPALEGAYALGAAEAQYGRSADALLAAYRVGARVAWRELSSVAVAADVEAQTLSDFAELVFAYIDELSAASVAGHTDHTESRLRDRERHREQLARALARGDSQADLLAAAELAEWRPPATLTAVIVPDAMARPVLALASPDSLHLAEDLEGLPEGHALLFLVGVGGRARGQLLRGLEARHAVVGPDRPWQRARSSWLRALRACALNPSGDEAIDTETRLGDLVLSADPEALADLRAVVLAPLKGLSPAAHSKLTDTLRLWILLHGRRDEIAEALFVHPQTVRYRVSQLRELYGDRLSDPAWIRDLTLALT